MSPLRLLSALFLVVSAPTLWGQQPIITTGSNLGTWSFGEVQLPLQATGGTGVYTWTLTSGTLPPGLSLRSDLPFPSYFPAQAQAGLIGIATTAGQYNFTLSVSSGGTPVQQAFSIKITSLNVKDPYGIPDAFVGVPYTYTLSAVNAAGPAVFTATSPLPDGLTLSSAGVISGTPTTPNFFNINFSIGDGTDVIYKGIGLLVAPVRITSPGALPNVSRGVAYNYTLTADRGTAPYTFTPNGGLPPGLTLAPNGQISGTVTNALGRRDVSITVRDQNGLTYTKNMSFDVLAPPVTAGYVQPQGPLDDCTVGVTCSRGFSVWNGGAFPFTWTVTGLPPGMSYRQGEGVTSSYIWPGNVEIFGTASTPGSYNIRVAATDAGGLVTAQNFTLKVSRLLQHWEDTLPNGARGSAYSKRLRVLGGTGTGYAVSMPGGRLPAGVSLSGDSVSGTPTENGFFNPGLLFSDSGGNTLSVTNYVNITTPANLNINDQYDLGQILLNVNYGRQLNACCIDPSGITWSLTSGNLPTGISLSPSGFLGGIPTAAGTYTFTVTATETATPSNYGVRVLRLIVTPLNFTNPFTLQYGNIGSSYSTGFTVTGAFNGLTFTLAPGSYLPPGVTLNPATGVLTGTPTETGQFFFALTATDGSGNTITRNFQLFVYPVGGSPPVSITTGADLGIRSIGPNEWALLATGGNGSYTWTLTGGTLPPGCSLRTDRPGYFPPSASANLSCVGTTPGLYSFSLRASSAGNFDSRTFNVKVTALRLKEQQLPDGEVGQPYSYTLHALDNAGPVVWSSSNLPPGLNLDPNTGVLSGTPTTAGSFSIPVTLNDGVDSFTWWVQPYLSVYAVRFTTPLRLPSPTQYLPYSATVAAATVTPGATCCTYSASGLPSGFTLNPSTGVISGTTTQGAGRFSFNITATDSLNVSRTKPATIIILGAPARLIYLNPYDSNGCSVGNPCSQAISAVNGGTPPFTYTASGLPAGMSIRWGEGVTSPYVNPNDAELWGNPAAAGSYDVTVTATDADGHTSTQTFPLVVSPLVVTDYLPNGTLGVVYSKQMRVIGGAGSYTATQVAGFFPLGLSATGLLVSGTPLENGSFAPEFVFSDPAGKTKRQRMYFWVGGETSTISIGPSFNLGTATLGSNYSNQLSACCAPSYTWTLTGGTLPPGLTLSSNGLLSGTLTTAGTFIFTVQAADQSNPSNFGVRQLRLIVTPINVTTSSGLPFGNVGTAYSQTLAATGATGSVTWTLDFFEFLPPGLQLNSSTGVLSGTPTTPGRYFFNITASDTAGNQFFRRYNLEVYPAGVNPPLSLNVGPNVGTSRIGQVDMQLFASGGTPPYHYSYTPAATPIPGMRVLDGPPLPTYYPADVSGSLAGVVVAPNTSYDTSLRVTDGLGATFDRPIHWPIVNTVHVSQSNPPKATVGVSYSFMVQGYGGNGSLSWAATGLPPGLTMTPAGIVFGTPTTAGTYNPNFTVTDLTNNLSMGYGHTIIVNPFAIATTGTLPQGTMGTAYSQQLSAPGCGTGCVWTLAGGSLPSGLTLGPDGLLSGTPTSFYNNGFLVQVAGSNGTTQKQFSLRIHFNTIQPLYISNGPVFGPSVLASQVAAALFAQGGAPGYTWSVLSGSLPPGVSLAGSGDAVGANFLPGIAYLAGRPMAPGTYNFTLQVTDSASATATKDFTWMVSRLAFSFTSLPIPGTNLTYNTAYSQPLLVLGGSGVYNSWSLASGSLPPGLQLNTTTGVISGTPTNTGYFTAGIQVTDTDGNTMTQSVNLTVAGPTGVVLNPGNSDFVTMQAGFNGVFGFNPSGGTPPYTYAPVTSYPAACSIQYGSAVVGSSAAYRLICAPMAPGDYTFTFRISDSAGNTGYRTMTVHVLPFTLFSSTTLPNASVSAPYAQSLIIWNGAGLTWTLAPGSMFPPGLSLVGSQIAGTPTQAGAYSFVLATTDPSGTPWSTTFNLNVSTIQITTPDIIPQAVIVNTPYTYAMSATGGGTKTWSATGLPSGLTMSGTGTISGTTGSTGSFRVTVTVTDGASTLTRPFTLFSRFADPPPPSFNILSTALADARVGVSFSATLNPSGGNPPFAWTVAPGSSLPPGLNLYSGTSLSDYSASQTVGLTYLEGTPATVGAYSFDLIATDRDGVQMRRTFTLHVTSTAILSGSLATGVVGTPYNQQLTGIGGAPPYTFTYSEGGLNFDMLPPGLSASPTGLISGTPTSTGNFSFRATVHDNTGQTYTATYSFTVTNAFGLLVNNTALFGAQLGVGISTTLATNGTSSYSWTVSAGSLPPGLALVPSGSNTILAGAPQAAGSFSFTVKATDTANTANFAERAYTVVVSPMMLLTHRVPANPPGRVGSPYSHTYELAGGAPPYVFSTLALSPIPPGLTLSPGGVLSGTPTQVGSYAFTIKVTDNNGLVGYLTPPTMNVIAAGAQNPILGRSLTFDQASTGVPYPGQLDGLANGGTPPYTWSVAPGSSLPPGIVLLPGGNGVSSYLGGIPTATGTYNVAMNVTDFNGRTANSLLTLAVRALAASPATFPNGRVGVPYSATYTPSGGAPPYTFALTASSSLPPGLTLSPTGALAGTPTSPGFFTVNVTIQDSTGKTLTTPRQIVIDNAGVAQGIGMPDTIQLNYILTGPAPSPMPLNVTGTSGTIPFNIAIAGIPGAAITPASGNAPANPVLSINPAGLTAGTYAGVVGVYSAQAVNQYTHTPIVLTVQNPPPCTYGLAPGSGSVAAAGGSGSFSVLTGSLCAWTPLVSDPAMITSISGSGPGSGTVSYTIAANPGTGQRSATITVGGQVFTVTQFGTTCSYAINPTSVNTTAAGGLATVSITASNAACSWTASGLGASPASGAGSSSVTLTIPANASPSGRVLTATVAGQTFTVNQGGINCTVALSAPSVSVPSAGGTGFVNVTTPAGCSYSTVLGPSWMPVTSGDTGAGPGPVALSYSVAANSTTLPRSGTLTIGDQTFTINQEATPCSVTVDASGLGSPLGSAGGSGSISVTANGPNCTWSAASAASWATISPTIGTGNGSVNVSAGSNASSTTERLTTLTIAGTSIELRQAGTACVYRLGSSTATAPAGGGNGGVSVSAPSVCTWSIAANPSAPWLTATAGASAGSGNVAFTAAPNPNAAPRAGTLTIAGQSFTVTQAAAPCNYALSNSSTTLAAGGGSSSFTFSTGAIGCSTTAVSYSDWLTVSTTGGGSAFGTVDFTAAANPAGNTRKATIQFGGQTFTVSQTGAACAYSLDTYGVLLGRSGGAGNVLGSPSAIGCTPPVGTDQPSFVMLGALSGPNANIFTLPYTVLNFNSILTAIRTATISFGGQTFIVKQTSW